MNPQYMPYAGGQQGFTQNRPPPPSSQGGFQNIPLGANRSIGPEPGAPHALPSQYGNLPPQGNRPPPSQLPPGQLPPGQYRLPSPNVPPPVGMQNGNDMGASYPMPGQPMAQPPQISTPAFNNAMPQGATPATSQGIVEQHHVPPPQSTPSKVEESASNTSITAPTEPNIISPSTNMPGQNTTPSPAQSMPPRPNMPPLPGQSMNSYGNVPQNMANQPLQLSQNMPPRGMAPMSSMGAQYPPVPNQVSPMANKMPPMSGPMQPMPGTMPPMPGPGSNMPPMPGPTSNMPPMPVKPMHMPPQLNARPPLPGQQQHMQNQMPGQIPNQYNQYNPNQLTNQMQGMNLGGSYPNAAINGNDNGPHMPPPLSQGGYLNGQQAGRPGGGIYPPMPGQGQMPNVGQYPSQPAYAQQQRRLDPDQMPSPIQVVQDDQKNRCGDFHVNQKGLVPPLVSTKFIAQDQGYASPRFLRSTMYNVPISNDLMKQTSVPFGLVISPMARILEQETPPPIVNFGELGPVRCVRCKAYMCPYMQFIDAGRRFQCLFCKASTDVPAEYFQHLDHTGQRMDRYQRAELVLGTYEFTATKDYCRNNTFPKPPAIVFVIDVSYNNVKSGLVQLLCSQMKGIIKNLPIDDGQDASNMRVGFITYNSSVHFYNIKGNLAAPQMLVVGDTQEMFMPLLDGFLCTPEESEVVIDALMEQIPAMFADTRECETILLPAIVAGLEALKASECAGKLLVFHSTLPTAEAPGKLKNRDDRKLLGTDKERSVLTPQNQLYNQLGQDCVGAGCSVDLFLFNNAYIDVATIGQVARLTGGEIYKYTYFQADIDGARLIKDIETDISRPIAFDAIMRVRTSTGVRPTDFYGHMFMSNTTDMELGSIDCDKAVAVEIKHDDKLQEEDGIYIQVALLYTSVSGQRRLRIINQALKTCSQMSDLYRTCDLETIMNFLSKQATFKLLDNNPKAVKESITQRAAQMLANYRKNCASPSSAGQLILPECMKLLPLYVNCLLRNDALSGGPDMTLDDRSYVMHAVMTMDVPTSVNYFYPRLIPLHEINLSGDKAVTIPSSIRCTIEKMTDQGVYILENGIHMFLWIGLGANQDFVQQVFGVPSAVQVNIDTVTLPELNNPLSKAIRSIIEQVRAQRHRYMRLTLVRQKEKMEGVFKHFMVEDRGMDGSPGYVDFLCHLHKEIRSLLS